MATATTSAAATLPALGGAPGSGPGLGCEPLLWGDPRLGQTAEARSRAVACSGGGRTRTAVRAAMCTAPGPRPWDTRCPSPQP